MNPSRATIPLIRPHQCDSEGGRIRGVLLYTKDQTIHADWLAIPSIVVDPVPAVLPAEVTKSIRHINNNKAPGSDDLNIELIKAIDDDSKMMAQLTHLCNQIITEGKWPAEFRGSI